MLLAQLDKRLEQDLAVTEDAARWTVDSWALALGVIAHSRPASVAAPPKRPVLAPATQPSRTPLPPWPSPARPTAPQPSWTAPSPVVTPARLRMPPPSIRYASLWDRGVAFVLDVIIILVLVFSVSAGAAIIDVVIGSPHHTSPRPVQGANIVLWLLIVWLYFLLQESSKRRATIGKRSTGIVVTGTQRERISFIQANVRYFAKFLSAVLLVGFMMAAFTKQRQALHDKLAGTLVVKGPCQWN